MEPIQSSSFVAVLIFFGFFEVVCETMVYVVIAVLPCDLAEDYEAVEDSFL